MEKDSNCAIVFVIGVFCFKYGVKVRKARPSLVKHYAHILMPEFDSLWLL